MFFRAQRLNSSRNGEPGTDPAGHSNFDKEKGRPVARSPFAA